MIIIKAFVEKYRAERQSLALSYNQRLALRLREAVQDCQSSMSGEEAAQRARASFNAMFYTEQQALREKYEKLAAQEGATLPEYC